MVGPGSPGCPRSWLPPAPRFTLGIFLWNLLTQGWVLMILLTRVTRSFSVSQGTSFLAFQLCGAWMIYHKIVSTEWEQIKKKKVKSNNLRQFKKNN